MGQPLPSPQAGFNSDFSQSQIERKENIVDYRYLIRSFCLTNTPINFFSELPDQWLWPYKNRSKYVAVRRKL